MGGDEPLDGEPPEPEDGATFVSEDAGPGPEKFLDLSLVHVRSFGHVRDRCGRSLRKSLVHGQGDALLWFAELRLCLGHRIRDRSQTFHSRSHRPDPSIRSVTITGSPVFMSRASLSSSWGLTAVRSDPLVGEDLVVGERHSNNRSTRPATL